MLFIRTWQIKETGHWPAFKPFHDPSRLLFKEKAVREMHKLPLVLAGYDVSPIWVRTPPPRAHPALTAFGIPFLKGRR